MEQKELDKVFRYFPISKTLIVLFWRYFNFKKFEKFSKNIHDGMSAHYAYKDAKNLNKQKVI